MENTTEIFDIEDADIDCDPSSDESKLITFLEERGLSSSYPYLKKSQVTFESLEYLTEDDIKEDHHACCYSSVVSGQAIRISKLRSMHLLLRLTKPRLSEMVESGAKQ
ncbi:hypothetical protein ACLKA6_016453 [Drosophila palustris]